MKFLVRNSNTKKTITQPTTSVEAKRICDRMNEANGSSLFEVVTTSTIFSELSTEKRPMTGDEIEAISKLKEIRYNPQTMHSTFVDSLFELSKRTKKEITEKQSVYLWHIVYHYRNQINDERLINIAKERKGY